MDADTRARLRRDLRERRRRLPGDARADAGLALARILLTSAPFRRARRVAAYVSADGEIDPGPFVSAARLHGREIYLPVIAPGGGTLRFVHTESGQALHPNRFGIPEPVSGRQCAPPFLDLVLVPLVGFDVAGNRLGMGAGYYDRTFGYLKRRRHWCTPRLVGTAYAFQRLDALDAADWDVPLDAVATDEGLSGFRSRA